MPRRPTRSSDAPPAPAGPDEVHAPHPGQPARGSRTGRPIMALLDLLGRRWTLRLLWELRTPSPTFRALQARCHDMSSSVLARRIAELTSTGIIATRDRGGYELTPEGTQLIAALGPLDHWARRWADRERRADERRARNAQRLAAPPR